jgi:GxxExxY protein
MLHEEITGAIIGSFYGVYNTLGFGFLEKVYENALAHYKSLTQRIRLIRFIRENPWLIHWRRK